jgi:hypothetical protein
MKKILVVASASFTLFIGCITMPDPVPDAYLTEKSAEDIKTIDKLSDVIIGKNHEIKGTRDKIKENNHSLEVEKGRLSILKDEKALLQEKHKQYLLEKDQAKVEENIKMIADKDTAIEAQTAKVEYTAALLEHSIAGNEVSEAELSVLVSELGFEKSRIAKAYLLKREQAAGDEGKKQKKGEALTYDEKYRKYLDRQREILASKKNDLEKAAVALKMAGEKIKK